VNWSKLGELLGKPFFDQARRDSIAVQAIDDVADSFAHLDHARKDLIDKHLTVWCSSTDFAQFLDDLDRLKPGEIQPAVESFEKTTQLRTEIIPGVSTAEAIKRFFESYIDRLVAQDPVLSQRLLRQNHDQISEQIAAVAKRIDDTAEHIVQVRANLAPFSQPSDRSAVLEMALKRYQHWIAEELGFIRLDGLPADIEHGLSRIELEQVFIPLKVFLTSDSNRVGMPIGEFLQTHKRIVLLAPPGGGKTTILKRLATAYSDPQRRSLVDDVLPLGKWLPLYVRCRELREQASQPIINFLCGLTDHAAMTEIEASCFTEFLHESLRSGQILILFDGLDEIWDEGELIAFAKNLRTFIEMFPQAAFVITCREPGFRLVDDILAKTCVKSQLLPFNGHDIRQLCENWYKLVMGTPDKIGEDARRLATIIWNDQRIRALAENPLLLSLLLVIRSSTRELPRNRAALYGDAVHVLIEAWNIEGFMPLDEDETLAQLSYVSCAMMEEGKQQIAYMPLLRLLHAARKELSSELQFTHLSPKDFVGRIEKRSSLLVQTFQKEGKQDMKPFYEFRHAVFQEFLAARGYVKEQYPGKDSGSSLANLLSPHFHDQRWLHVIALALVLAGPNAEESVRLLAHECHEPEESYHYLRTAIRQVRAQLEGNTVYQPGVAAQCLLQCLLDEVQVTVPTLESALHEIAIFPDLRWKRLQLSDCNFWDTYLKLVEDAYTSGTGEWHRYAEAAAEVALVLLTPTEAANAELRLLKQIVLVLRGADRLAKIRGALAFTLLNPQTMNRDKAQQKLKARLIKQAWFALIHTIDQTDSPLTLAVTTAMSCATTMDLGFTLPIKPRTLLSLYAQWRDSTNPAVSWLAASALSSQDLLARDAIPEDLWGDSRLFLEEMLEHPDVIRRMAALIVVWYRPNLFSDDEVMALINKIARVHSQPVFRGSTRMVKKFLMGLGESGRKLWHQLEKDLDHTGLSSRHILNFRGFPEV
jgi:hypothetical protein